MKHKFEIGEIVTVRGQPKPQWTDYIGHECEIVAVPQLSPYTTSLLRGGKCQAHVYIIRFNDGLALMVEEKYLCKRRPPEQFEAGQWADCLFKPKGIPA